MMAPSPTPVRVIVAVATSAVDDRRIKDENLAGWRNNWGTLTEMVTGIWMTVNAAMRLSWMVTRTTEVNVECEDIAHITDAFTVTAYTDDNELMESLENEMR